MIGRRCEECGATYASAEESCASRFDELLALDHSRTEPWGSRHGLAFAAYAAQHPQRYGPASAAHGLATLRRTYGEGELLGVTIADLGSFPAESYAADLDRWCRSVVAAARAGGGAP